MKPAAEQIEVLTRGAVDVVRAEELEARLAEGRPLRVKAGFDPTRPDLHLGHTVLLRKMRHFQDLGHEVVFLVGDFTAMIGDPTGQDAMRPRLSRDEVAASAATYERQAFKVLDPDRTVVRHNSEWLDRLGAADFVELCSRCTVARVLERADFAERMREGRPVYQHEILYPLVQAYDSVALRCDVELGGTDQLFNLMVGRDLMPRYGLPAQIVLTVPILEGLDATVADGRIVGRKMSKSAGNHVGLTDPPLEMFRKCMQVHDAVIWRYFDLLSAQSAAEVAQMRRDVEAGRRSPLDAKAAFASEMVERFHSPEAAVSARREFESAYTGTGTPDEIPDVSVPAQGDSLALAKALAAAALVKSVGEGRRLVEQGGVELDGARVTDPFLPLVSGKPYVVKVGSKSRRFARLLVVAGAKTSV